MQVLDYRHSEPTPSPPHNSSWLLDNQPASSPTPQTSSLPNHHNVLPLAPSNSFTGVSSHHPPPTSTPLHASSSSTAHPSSHPSSRPSPHPSHVSSELYPIHNPSTPRGPHLTDHSRLSNITANNPTHSSLSKFGNLLNVTHVPVEQDRDHNHASNHNDPPFSASLNTEPHRDHIPHTYAQPTQPYSAPHDYRHFSTPYYDQPHLTQPETPPFDRNDLYQPMHRPQFQTDPYNPINSSHRQVYFNYHNPPTPHLDYARHSTDAYHNNTCPPYPGAAPLPIYKDRAYHVPKFEKDAAQRTEVVPESTPSVYHSYKPISGEAVTIPNAFTSGHRSTPGVSVEPMRKYGNMQELGAGGTLLRDAINSFEAKGMTPERVEFLRDYMELMRAYEEKFDVLYDRTVQSSMELTLKSRVPLLEDTITAPVDDETPDDACQKLVVKRRFVDAMEALQGDQLPTKRRGNLPKECTEYLRRWFEEHDEHPCKFPFLTERGLRECDAEKQKS